jgi:hypothetical protein
MSAVGSSVVVTSGGANTYIVEFQGALAGHDASTLVADAGSLVNTIQLGGNPGGNLNVTVARDASNTSADDLRKDVQSAIDSALVGGGFTIGAISNGGSITAANLPWTATSNLPPWDVPFTVTIPVVGTPPTVTGSGTLTRGSVIALGLAAALQQAIANAIRNANVSGLTVTVTLDVSGKVMIASSGGQITVDFTSPIQVATGGGRVSITASGAKYSTAAGTTISPSVDMQPRADISLDYADTAFQGLGLTSTPTRFDYSGTATKSPIAFTLFVNGTAVPVNLASVSYTDIAGLVSQLSSVLSTALTGAGLAATAVTVCRVNLDPNATGAEQCQGTGSRIVLQVDPNVVNSLSIFVPDLAGGMPNGAIIELGFAAGQSETKRAHATEFFFQDVKLQGSFQFVVQNVTATASLGFLSITATGHGTLGPDGMAGGGNDLIALTGSIELKNPVAQLI